jgi:hypothetical protein
METEVFETGEGVVAWSSKPEQSPIIRVLGHSSEADCSTLLLSLWGPVPWVDGGACIAGIGKSCSIGGLTSGIGMVTVTVGSPPFLQGLQLPDCQIDNRRSS